MTDGPISRLCLATVPDRGLGAAMPRHGRYDEKYDASLRPFIDNLRQAQGLIVCKQAKRMAENLKADLDTYVIQAGSEILDNLGHRALVHAFRKACLLYVANGMKWEAQIAAFCRWSLHYDLWLKHHFFGELIRSADGEVKTAKVGARNLLQQLPKNFSRLNLVEVRLANAMKEEGTDSQLRQWVHRGFIAKTGDGMYERVTV